MASLRVLVVNAGSSSLKCRLVQVAEHPHHEPERVQSRWSASVSGIPGQVSIRGVPSEGSPPIRDHGDALRVLLAHVDVREIDAVGHRVVHGGSRFREPVRLTDRTIAALDDLSVLAPLHNPPSLTAIRAARAVLGRDRPMVAVFDTAFHADLPSVAATYAIPRDLAARHHIRRYGFHGLAHASLAAGAARHLGRPLETLRLITLQLGNGCSAAAIRDGRSIDTSMGMTPLEGLVMGTRSGDLDPALVAFLSKVEGVDAATVEDWLTHRSGLLGVSGLSHDMRELLAAAASGHAGAAAAIELFCYRARKYIGAYLAVLGGADAVVFGGGIGESAPSIRGRICLGLDWVGLIWDHRRNEAAVGLVPPRTASISPEHATIQALVVPVDEESLLAAQVADCLSAG